MDTQPLPDNSLARFGGPAHMAVGAAAPWLRDLRAGAAAHFAETGLPSPRDEAWKYTNLRPLAALDFAAPDDPPAGATVAIDHLPSLLPQSHGGHRVVFVNGRFAPDLSAVDNLPEGVEMASLAALLRARPESLAGQLGAIANGANGAMLALNTAMMGDGLVLRVKREHTVDLPIEVVYVTAASARPIAYHPRNIIVMEPGAHATLAEHHASLDGGAYLTNGVTEIRIGAGATLHHYKVQTESDAAFHIATLHAEVGRDGLYNGFALTRGGRLTRNEATVRLAAPGAEGRLNGVYMLRGEQHCDTTTLIDHEAPHTSSREVFKGAIDDRARGVFQGRIVVRPDAQKSDGHQLSKALLLSDRAEIDAKPELEIYADDVKCSHGAAIGDLDRDALFYLRARGIPEAEARHMLVEAFLADTIAELAAERLCPALMASVGHWLSDALDRSEP
ncbi:MAG: Fe-S cluster assembly protein SufD [Kiloniellaceae bacterium]